LPTSDFVKGDNKVIITRMIKAPKRRTKQPRPTDELASYRRRQMMQSRATKQLTVRSDGVTRCSKCPPKHCCPDCARINNARQVAGLIRPRGDPHPHPNNCLPCIPRSQSYVGQRPMKVPNAPSEIVSIDVKPLGGGWYEGSASLGLETVYAAKFRSSDAARRYAVNSMVSIRDGLRFEALVNG
jgi:hypothetical protein